MIFTLNKEKSVHKCIYLKKKQLITKKNKELAYFKLFFEMTVNVLQIF